jgi:hypothetical protein
MMKLHTFKTFAITAEATFATFILYRHCPNFLAAFSDNIYKVFPAISIRSLVSRTFTLIYSGMLHR